MSLLDRRNAAAAELAKMADTAETLITRDGFDPESSDFTALTADMDAKRAEVERFDRLISTAERAQPISAPQRPGEDWASEMLRSMADTGKCREAMVPLDRAYGVLTSTQPALEVQPIDTRPAPAPWGLVTPTIDSSTVVNLAGNTYRYITMPTPVAAVAVAENAPKPAVEFASTELSGTLGKVAHILDVTQETLEDMPSARQILSNWLIEGVQRKLEADAAAALTGGTGFLTIAAQTSATAVVRVAMATLAAQGLRANAVHLNPADHAALDLEIFAAAGTESRTVWQTSLFGGVAIIPNPAVTAKTLFVGDFKAGLLHLRRSTVSVDITDSGMTVETTPRDRFTHNLYGFRAEARASTILQQPKAIVKGTWA